MSTRWYPLYQRGNPQLRVFLPNFWIKLVKPEQHIPSNIVTFHVSIQMTKNDVKNYLEKIYKVPVMKVNTRIAIGKTRKEQLRGSIVKDDDVKIAYVWLNKDETFEFPDIFTNEKTQREDKIKNNSLKELMQEHAKFLKRNQHAQGAPGWYSL